MQNFDRIFGSRANAAVTSESQQAFCSDDSVWLSKFCADADDMHRIRNEQSSRWRQGALPIRRE